MHSLSFGFQIPDVKVMYNTALKSSPNYHKDRRLFLSQLMKDYCLLYRECPGKLKTAYINASTSTCSQCLLCVQKLVTIFS